jgi:hypothetical protein
VFWLLAALTAAWAVGLAMGAALMKLPLPKPPKQA